VAMVGEKWSRSWLPDDNAPTLKLWGLFGAISVGKAEAVPFRLGGLLGSVRNQSQMPVALGTERGGLFGKFHPRLGHIHEHGFGSGVRGGVRLLQAFKGILPVILGTHRTTFRPHTQPTDRKLSSGWRVPVRGGNKEPWPALL
jgi:hypothetical protein